MDFIVIETNAFDKTAIIKGWFGNRKKAIKHKDFCNSFIKNDSESCKVLTFNQANKKYQLFV